MSGTDRTVRPVLGGPTVVLVAPQLGENIGFAARAMLNCGLTDLRLVRPRDGWPNPQAEAAASGALEVIAPVRVYDSTGEAVADLGRVYATTARRRDLEHVVVTPGQAAAEMRAHQANGESVGVGVLFGAERSGLNNDDVALADAAITVPLNPAFSSLNLGQAVLLVAYEWLRAGDDTPARARTDTGEPLATKEALLQLMRHLEQELDRAAFFRVPENRPAMVRALRVWLTRSAPTAQEVRTLHGVFTALSGHRLGGERRGQRRSPEGADTEDDSILARGRPPSDSS